MTLYESYTWEVTKDGYSSFLVVAPTISEALEVAQQAKGRGGRVDATLIGLKRTGRVVLGS